MIFSDFDEKDNDRYRSYYLKCIQMTADMTPFNLLSLRGEPSYVKRAYAWDLCFHQAVADGQTPYLCPVGDLDEADWERIFAEEFPSGSYFWGIPELLMKRWKAVLGDRIEIEESRDSWDYVWYTKRMSDLEGHDFKSYRKAMNRFVKNNRFSEEPVTPARFDEIRAFHREQIEQLRLRTTAEEIVEFDDKTFETALDCWDDRWLYGTIFRVDGKIAGVLINELIDENNVVGLYQKQVRDYDGLTEYMYISDCKKMLGEGYLIINVMSDAGSEGLRAAKERSHPLVMLKKYNITVR